MSDPHKNWLVQKQTALGVNTTRSDEDRLEIMELMVFWLPKIECVGIRVNVAGLKVSVARHKLLLFSLMIWCCSLSAVRLQALVDKKKVVITEATIRDALRLDNAEGVNCLPNEEIFAKLACMGYEKPSTKLTFYKAFFSSQWKFLIHTILQSLSAKRTSWNEFSSAMAYAVICLSTGDLSTHTTTYTSPALTQKVFTNMRRVGKGFSGVETPLFAGMLVAEVVEEGGDADEQVQDVATDTTAQGADTTVHEPSLPSPTPPTPPPQQSQDLSSTSQVQHTPPQSPLPQSQPPPQAQPQDVDFSMSLLQEVLDAYAVITRRVEHLEYDKVAQALEITKLKRRVFANIRRVGKGCSGVKTPLFKGMLVAREPEEQSDTEEQGNADNAAEEPVTAVSKYDVEDQSIPSPTPPTPPP
nr:hypothetical protein [Tanacetum cinerariifolium]